MIKSNGAIKRRVRTGALCCICEKRPPTVEHRLTGAQMCERCAQGVVVMQRAYGVQGGGIVFVERRMPQQDTSPQHCPFCVVLLPDQQEQWNRVGNDFYGDLPMIGPVRCCATCKKVALVLDDEDELLAMVKGVQK